MRSAIDWALDAGQDEVALRLTAATGWFWWVRGYWRESQEWFHRVYEATPDADPILRSRAVYKVAGLEIQRARPSEVVPLLEQILPVVEEHGTELDVAWVISLLADASRDRERGIELGTDSRRRFSAIGDAWGEAYASMNLGYQLWGESQSEGNALMRGAIETLSALGDRWTAGWFGFNFGYGEFGFDCDMLQWRTEPLPPGTYPLKLTVVDAAGNESSPAERTIDLDTWARPASGPTVESYDSGTDTLELSFTASEDIS